MSRDYVGQALEGMVFDDEVMEGAHFDEATLQDCSFSNCDLYWASFSCATLISVCFKRCDLRGSDFADAKLRECRFEQCNFAEDNLGGIANFEDAEFVCSEFVGCVSPPELERSNGTERDQTGRGVVSEKLPCEPE